MLELKDIKKSFGENHVLNGIDLSFEKGRIYTLVGGNGTGKTTVFNLITGFLKPDNGDISLEGKSLTGLSPIKINARGITRTFQDLRLITQLTVKENILLSFKNNPGEKIGNSILPSRMFRKDYAAFSKRADAIVEKIHLTEVADHLAGEISYGQQKLLTIGCCLANDAELLLLDEPVAGIDKENYQRIYDLLTNLKKEGKTIIQIEHHHGFVENLSDGIYFLYAGTASFFENYGQFINDDTVKKVYLA